MSCNHEGSTHFACECVLAQLAAADRLAEAAKRRLTDPNYLIGEIEDVLMAYEKLRKP